jgi:hypothetical protein
MNVWKWVAVAVLWVAGTIGVAAVFVSLPDPDAAALRAHPVKSWATVTSTYINGFGGEPAVRQESARPAECFTNRTDMQATLDS